MRRNLCGPAAAALFVATGLLATARGDDQAAKSSWTSRLWPWGKKVPEAQRDVAGQAADKHKAQVESARKLRAELDWKRRAEVCQKLRQIAFETKDDELDRFAERLDQRAWDAYLKQVGAGAGVAAVSGKERAAVERIGVDFSHPNVSLKTSPEEMNATKSREDR